MPAWTPSSKRARSAASRSGSFERPGRRATRARISATPPGGTRNSLAGSSTTSSDRPEAALVGRIEDAHRIDLVAEELDPDRQRRGGGEDVHEAAAPGELAPAGDLEDRVVAQGQQLAEQRVLADAGAGAQPAGLGRQLVWVEGVLQERLDARDQDAGAPGPPCRQGGHARRGLVADQLAALVGQRGSRFQHRHGVGIAEPGLEFLGHAIADLGVARNPAQPLAGR